MPFLIKQVLFYIYYQMKLRRYREITIERFLYDLDKRGVSKTKKFLDIGGLTPEKYYQMKKYIQPKNPCPYKGQKKEETAEAIKNLAYQAGKYSYYVDLFGGSGSATAALFPQDKVKQVYNEKHRTVYNYFEVISSDRYEELQKAIDIVREDLSRPDYEISPYFGFDIPATIKEYIEFKREHAQKSEESVIEDEMAIYNRMGKEFIFDEESVINFMEKFPFYIEISSEEVDKYLVKHKNKISIDEIKTWNKLEDFYNNLHLIKDLSSRIRIIPNHVTMNLYGKTDGESAINNFNDYSISIKKLKALGYFAYFYLLRNTAGGISKDKKVQYAVGEIYLRYMAIQGNIRSSAVLSCDDCEESYREEVDNFIDRDLENCIESFHSRVRRCYNQDLLRNCDFEDVINEFANKSGNVLFYVDSPYIGTSDYGDKANGVEDFTTEDMDRLIERLMESNKKFIFSMRAVITGGTDNNKIKGNNQLKEHVYEQFNKLSKPSKPLYVLVILRQDWILEDAIKDGKKIEIMITNFLIVSFDNYKRSKNAKKEIYKYEVYKFKDFKKIVED